jgi:hypothetical protein
LQERSQAVLNEWFAPQSQNHFHTFSVACKNVHESFESSGGILLFQGRQSNWLTVSRSCRYLGFLIVQIELSIAQSE